MATREPTHVLENKEQLTQITLRVKRAHGQMGAIVRMLDEGRSCDEIVTQMSAVSKAVHTAAFMLISASLRECIADPEIDSEAVSKKLQRLFLSLA
jgi:DNA-binding FrmR family transcriptional regulator